MTGSWLPNTAGYFACKVLKDTSASAALRWVVICTKWPTGVAGAGRWSDSSGSTRIVRTDRGGSEPVTGGESDHDGCWRNMLGAISCACAIDSSAGTIVPDRIEHSARFDLCRNGLPPRRSIACIRPRREDQTDALSPCQQVGQEQRDPGRHRDEHREQHHDHQIRQGHLGDVAEAIAG